MAPADSSTAPNSVALPQNASDTPQGIMQVLQQDILAADSPPEAELTRITAAVDKPRVAELNLVQRPLYLAVFGRERRLQALLVPC